MAGKSKDRPQGRPAVSPEERENQLTALAYDVAEQQMREGTATSQIVHHFLKSGSRREELELERLRRENLLLEAKAKQIEAAEDLRELYGEAITAMKVYQGQAEDDEYGYED